MSDIRNRVQDIDPSIKSLDVNSLIKETHNIYESLAIISKRARHLTVDIKQELKQKLEEFAVTSDIIEEVSENKEQIEISKFYERLPDSTIIAMKEFLDGDLFYKYKEEREEE